jgi:hypothetical protein
MNRWLRFIALLLIAGFSIALGIAPEAGFDHVWLSLALIAIFAASEARYWDSPKRQV